MSIQFSSNLGNVGVYLIEDKNLSVKKVLCCVLMGAFQGTDKLWVFRADTKTFCKLQRIVANADELERDDFEFKWEVVKESESYKQLVSD